jgi:sporulation protein YlmC with PRC-barrel domain
MLITIKKLLNLPVITQSGSKLGGVRDIELDIDSHLVRAYHVGHKLPGMEKHLITPTQVVSITVEKMIVKDGIMPELGKGALKTKTTTPQMAVTIEEK